MHRKKVFGRHRRPLPASPPREGEDDFVAAFAAHDDSSQSADHLHHRGPAELKTLVESCSTREGRRESLRQARCTDDLALLMDAARASGAADVLNIVCELADQPGLETGSKEALRDIAAYVTALWREKTLSEYGYQAMPFPEGVN